jgi:hypothetical protein
MFIRVFSFKFVAILLWSLSTPTQASLIGFSDVVVEFFNSGNGSSTTCTGPDAATNPVCQAVNITVGNNGSFFPITSGSFITLGFLDEFILDGPGNDIFIREIGNGFEFANIFVSSTLSTDSNDFTFLGRANGNTISSFDLGAINFTDQVRAVRVSSLSNGGSAPGFDLASVQALQFVPSQIQVSEPSNLFAISFLVMGVLLYNRKRRS